MYKSSDMKTVHGRCILGALHEISETLFDKTDEIPEGVYLKLMNSTKLILQATEILDTKVHQHRRQPNLVTLRRNEEIARFPVPVPVPDRAPAPVPDRAPVLFHPALTRRYLRGKVVSELVSICRRLRVEDTLD